MVLETHMKLCMTELDFPGKKNLPPPQKKFGKWAKNGPKTEFFEFSEKFGNFY